MAKRKTLLTVAGSIFCVSLLYFTYSFYQHFKIISRYPVTAWTEDHRADCGVVLTGGPNRIEDAFEQLYLKRIKKLIVAGVFPKVQLREIFPQQFFYGDLDENDIILEKRSLSTYGNAQQVLPLLEALNCKDVVLITSKLHMTRAYRTFRAHVHQEIPIYQRATSGLRYRPHWTRVGAETLKSVFYDLWFY